VVAVGAIPPAVLRASRTSFGCSTSATKKPQVTEAGDDLVSRARYLVQVAEVEGKPVGRGTLSHELDIPENQAPQRLAEVRQSDT
jgi:hypothetical protein